MYMLLCFVLSMFFFLTIKLCMFHHDNGKWPKNSKELLNWRASSFSRFLLFLIAVFPILVGSTKPLAGLGADGFVVLVFFSVPVIVFFISYFKGGK